ncbi:hypothetical protein M9H77_30011 [Catharanthus roseus]|uniref:Uncharacterized protein n=1 Tax=Catharanthus roseus TaxID=4058 RepID=A0ACB9ZWD5_CATRO|nr:hypothetical protein M9H77_30011 [Catharanthus roseus]
MWLFKRKGPSGFSYFSTAEEVTEGIDGSGLTAIVTGASSGIGFETARVLALRGVHVVMAVRNVTAGNEVKEAIMKEIPSARVDVVELDLSSLASVKNFASQFQSSGRPLNILINNAGVMAIPFKLSRDNIELQFATNHFGPFLLTNLLLDTMKRTAQETKKEGRIINVSSDAHRFSSVIRFDRINVQEGHNRYMTYSQSKLANILHANELARRLKEEGVVDITANSIHPGAISTNLFRHSSIVNGIISIVGKLMFKSVQQGASTTCYVALHPQVKGISGEYFYDNNIGKTTSMAKDSDLAMRLWDYSTNLVNSKKDGDDDSFP